MTTDPATVLVVDDEQQLLSLVTYALRSAGMTIHAATTGHEALDVLDTEPVDLVVLDVMLPDINGIDLCRTIRRRSHAPVLFLTARSDQTDVIRGLEAGGDDYLAKPFSVEELLLRINAILRRAGTTNTEIRCGNLRLRPDTHEALVDDTPIDLTPLEFRFLRHLAINHDRIIDTTELVEEVWGVTDLGAHDPIVKSVVYRLRQKLDRPTPATVEIRNVRAIGYRLRPTV